MNEYHTILTEEQFKKHKSMLDDFVFHRKVENGIEIKTSFKSAIEYLQKIKEDDKKY